MCAVNRKSKHVWAIFSNDNYQNYIRCVWVYIWEIILLSPGWDQTYDQCMLVLRRNHAFAQQKTIMRRFSLKNYSVRMTFYSAMSSDKKHIICKVQTLLTLYEKNHNICVTGVLFYMWPLIAYTVKSTPRDNLPEHGRLLQRVYRFLGRNNLQLWYCLCL